MTRAHPEFSNSVTEDGLVDGLGSPFGGIKDDGANAASILKDVNPAAPVSSDGIPMTTTPLQDAGGAAEAFAGINANGEKVEAGAENGTSVEKKADVVAALSLSVAARCFK